MNVAVTGGSPLRGNLVVVVGVEVDWLGWLECLDCLAWLGWIQFVGKLADWCVG